VINADQIIVLTEAGIVERGRHQELIENGGEYAQLYNEQFSAELAG
jgi:ATP-binding cassette subfamily B protein